ncbi:MAG: hypothetical protein V4688_07475 [Pseudomonadota bacterium]
MDIRGRWKRDLLLTRENSQRSACVSKFKSLPSEQAKRASYFSEISKPIRELGLGNPHEKSALSIEPTHPVPSKYLGHAIGKLGLEESLCASFHENKLSLLSLPMLEKYSPSSDAKDMARSKYMAPLHLLDPLYGFAFFREEGRIRNHCFALDTWKSHLSSMPQSLAQKLWENRADNMLSGGAFAGRLIFEGAIPPAQDNFERSTVPEICVATESELLALVQCLKLQADKHNGVELWFRGQSKEYLTPDRFSLTKLGITPYSNIREADLTPSLYRNYDSHLDSFDSFEQIVIELAEWVYWANQLIPKPGLESFVPPAKGVAAVTRLGINSYQRSLILQQYGAPSAYLDITRDASIAAWFATHKCSKNSDQRMIYQDYQWSSEGRESWPTIFVFPLVKGVHPYLDLESILKDSNALRPKRQKCGLLGGAGNLARNYCARYMGLKIRLKPGFKLSTPVTPLTLFPSATEDLALAHLQDVGLGETQRLFQLSELA